MTQSLPANTTKSLKYNPQFDGLRFCAVLFVASYHWLHFLYENPRSFFFGGLVNFFFVLSGYLITKILFSAKAKVVELHLPAYKAITGFLLRRVIRIFPAYYLILFVCVLLPTIGAEVRNHAATYFTYTSNFQVFHSQAWPPITAQFWTLAVEEQFYLVWPLLIIFIPGKHFLKTFFLIIIGTIVLKVIFYHPGYIVPQDILTQYSVDAFAAGGILAYKHTMATAAERQFIKRLFNLLFYIGIPVSIGIIMAESYYLSFVINRFLFIVFSVKIVEGAITGYKNRFGNFLQNKMVLYLGKISYGIYLWHLLVPALFWKSYAIIYEHLSTAFPAYFSVHQDSIAAFEKFLSSDITCYFIYWALTIAVASLSWTLIEQPFNKLKYFLKTPAREANTRKYAMEDAVNK